MIRSVLLHRTRLCVLPKLSFSKGFLQNLLDKIKEESGRDAELKESIRKFREETAKLEQSQELQSIRDIYKKIEKDLPTDTVDRLKSLYSQLSEKIKEDGQRISSNESLKRCLENALRATEQMVDVSKSLTNTEFVKAARRAVEALEKDLQSDRAKVYEPLKTLKTRAEIAGKFEERMILPDSESSGVVLHKDSKWHTAWQDFKNTNQYVQKFFDLKTQYEESDHLVARSLRYVTDRVSQLFGVSGSASELQAAMDEIMKMDPDFDTEKFLRYCRFVAIPNVLEAFTRWELTILSDWCHEAPFNVLTSQIKQLKSAGYVPCSQILDVSNVDLQTAKMTEQGPILIITFQTQQIECVRDLKGQVYMGDPHKVLRVTHLWALCRNQNELHPWAAWRVLDIASMPADQWL